MGALRLRDTALLTLVGMAVAASAVVITSGPAVRMGLIAVSALLFGYLALFHFPLLTMAMIALRTSIELVPEAGSGRLLRASVVLTGAYTVAAVVWLIRHPPPPARRTSWLAVATVAVAGTSVVSALLSPDPVQAAMGASRWVFLALFVMVLERITKNEESIRHLIYALALSSLVPLGMGAWQVAEGGPPVMAGVERISGSLSHPNTFGFYLAVIVIALTSVSRFLPSPQRWLVLAVIPPALAELALTYSRTSYVALIVGLGVVVVAGRRWLALATVTALVVAMPLLIPGVVERWSDISAGPTLRGTPGNSLAWRVDYWGEIVEISSERRVTGVGLGVVSDLAAEQREPHNDFVRALVELGAIGLAAYLILMGTLVGRAWSRFSETRHRHDLGRGLAEGLAGLVAAFLVGSVTGNLMTQLVLLWYVLAFAVAAGPTAAHQSGTMETSRA